MPSITPIYAALLTFLFLYLSSKVIAGRGKYKVSLGDGGHPEMVGLIRAQGNFVEYVPLSLLLLLLIELRGAPAIALHGLGLMLLIGRILHGIGVAQEKSVNKLRFWGSVLSLLMLIFAALGLLAHSLFS